MPVSRDSFTGTDTKAPSPVSFLEYTVAVADTSMPGSPEILKSYGEVASPAQLDEVAVWIHTAFLVIAGAP